MAELDQAARRLQAALDRLEQAIDARATDAAGDAQLRKALDSARAENDRLKQIAETVAGRLDGTITRLKATLNG